MAQYQVLRMDLEGTPPLLANGIPLVWEEPEKAAKYAKEMGRHMGEKLCVKAIVNEKWRQREDARLKKGDYRHLPWRAQAWWAAAYPVWKDHYPHASLEKPGYIAYTKSPEDGMKDKQSLLKPGSYLDKYFKKEMFNYGVFQADLVKQFMTMYGPIDIKFAETEADIVQVYAASGQMTCIYNDRYYGKQPMSVYAYGDLQIAYLGDKDRKVTARSLVWPAKKLHSRVYGDIARLTQGLQRLGYTNHPACMVGAKIKRIPTDVKAEYKNGRIPHGCFVVPYIDKKNQQGGGHLGVIDKGDHLEIVMDNTPGSHHCGLPDGVSGNYVPRLDEAPMFTCDRCQEATPDPLINVYLDGPDEDGDLDHDSLQQWCHDCRQVASWKCHYSGEYFDKHVDRVVVSGRYWLPRYADMYAVTCEATGKLYAKNNVSEVWDNDGKRGRVLSHEYIGLKIGQTFISDLTGRMYARGQRIIVQQAGRKFVGAKCELKYHAFECDECGGNHMINTRNESGDKLYCNDCFGRLKFGPPKPKENPYMPGTFSHQKWVLAN